MSAPRQGTADDVQVLFDSVYRAHDGLRAVLAAKKTAGAAGECGRAAGLEAAQEALCEFLSMMLNDMSCVLSDALSSAPGAKDGAS